ncbi:MAG: sugar ABC transporter permease [Chloroflexi bacterium]|nr:sugar ABC transporter permease [Chloroflexota bacterium]
MRSTIEQPAARLPAGSEIWRVRWRRYQGMLFILPWFVGFLIFSFGPFLASLVISFTNWNMVDPPKFVALDNYTRLFTDENYIKSLFNTLYYTIFHVPGQIILAFGIACLLNRQVHGLPLFRTCFYLPAITSGAATAIIWLFLFQPKGLINQALEAVGLPGPNWLGSTQWAMPTLILMSFWNIGTPMVLFLAGLQGVPQSLYEAAEIDGAGWWGKLRFITIPMMTPYFFLTAVLGVIGSFQVFTSALLVTGGGPANATLFLVLYLYWNGWSYFKMGYASAMAWMLLVMILLFTAFQFWISKRWVYYEGETRR